MSKKDRTSLERALVGPAGEHYVLFQLHMQGMLASLALHGPPMPSEALRRLEVIASASPAS
jgi:hypothetical protein